MIRARASLPLLLLGITTLAAAACATERKPITGFDHPPPGSIVLDSDAGGGGGSLMLWPMFDLPIDPPQQIFRPRLGGQDAVVVTSQEGFYDYSKLYLSGWTAGWDSWLTGVPPGTYVVELVDAAGQSWGESAPLAVSAGPIIYTDALQIPAVVFAHFDGKVTSWNVEPALQDSDTATDEITVTNMADEDVVVERCMVVSGKPTSCTSVGTVAAGADLHTVETVNGTSMSDHQALHVRLASNASQFYERNLVEGSGSFGIGTCQVERIIFHGNRSQALGQPTPTGSSSIAMSSCYGYQSGPS